MLSAAPLIDSLSARAQPEGGQGPAGAVKPVLNVLNLC